MAFHLHGGKGCVALLTVLLVPGAIAAYLTHSMVWTAVWPACLVVIMLVVAALPFKRKVTPQKWADELEKHLLGTDGAWGWDDATSVTLADERLESVRRRLVPSFDLLDTPGKREELRQIIEALRREDVP